MRCGKCQNHPALTNFPFCSFCALKLRDKQMMDQAQALAIELEQKNSPGGRDRG